MIIVHSFIVPFFWIDDKGPYLIDDEGRRDLPQGTTRDQILWFKKPHKGGKNPAFEREIEWDVEGTKGKKYLVTLKGKAWECNCYSYKFSGNKRTCKHIEDIKGSYLS